MSHEQGTWDAVSHLAHIGGNMLTHCVARLPMHGSLVGSIYASTYRGSSYASQARLRPPQTRGASRYGCKQQDCGTKCLRRKAIWRKTPLQLLQGLLATAKTELAKTQQTAPGTSKPMGKLYIQQGGTEKHNSSCTEGTTLPRLLLEGEQIVHTTLMLCCSCPALHAHGAAIQRLAC